MKRTTALFATAAVAASLFTGVAFASDVEAAVAPTSEAVTSDAGPGHGHNGNGHRANRLLQPIAEILGMTPGELQQALSDGTTLAEVAVDQGMTVEDLSAVLSAEVDSRVAEALADGKITQERADEILANSADRIDRLINRSHEQGEGKEARSERRTDAREAMADFLDLSLEEMREAYQDGSTLGEIATDQGITIDELTAFMTDYVNAEIDEALADGTITEEQAARFRENLAERIENRINREPGSGNPGGHGRPPRP
jgi:polyhydroxyalkanoate synthesis regulator phasin